MSYKCNVKYKINSMGFYKDKIKILKNRSDYYNLLWEINNKKIFIQDKEWLIWKYKSVE